MLDLLLGNGRHHLQSVVDGCFYVLKLYLDRIYRFGDSAILDVRVFA